eukprot:gene6185-6423_t
MFLDSEGAALSTLASYIEWVNSKCGDPRNVTSGRCLQLKGDLCGSEENSEVLCITSGAIPAVSFRSSSRDTRVEYLRKDVVCLKDGADFKDVETGKVALRGDSATGLLYAYRPE